MKMFKFSLQKVLDVRCMIEDAKAIEMKKSQAEILLNKQALSVTQCEKDGIIANGKAGSVPGRVTLHSLYNRSDYVDQLSSKITDQGDMVEKSEEQAEEKRLSLVEASKHKNAIEKLNYDLFYIKNMSITMDIIIILRTIKTVLFGKGAR